MFCKMKYKYNVWVSIFGLKGIFAISVIIISKCASSSESTPTPQIIAEPTAATMEGKDGQFVGHAPYNSSEEIRFGLDWGKALDAFDLTEISKSTVRFYLFSNQKYSITTGTMQGSQEIIHKNLKSLQQSNYMKDAPLKILIHGYKNTGFSYFPHRVKEAYIDRDNETNVICVDWRKLASALVYFNSAWNAKIVGERIGEFLLFLHHQDYLPSYRDVHIVGFSLGAQVAGFAGKFIHASTFQQLKIGRITGLDPAGPAFFRADAGRRLDSSDADFTDVIHTSIGKSGMRRSVGHIDFFPNGGNNQPGCKFEKLVDPFLQDCSHRRAPDLFEHSILGAKMYACKCRDVSEFEENRCNCINKITHYQRVTSDFALMGEFVNKSLRGNYFLLTDGAPPFTLKHNYILDTNETLFIK